MKTVLFLFAAFCLSVCSAGEFRAAPDDGGLKPYIEDIGRNKETFQALIMNHLSVSYSQSEAQKFRDILLPNLNDKLPNMTSPECVGCQIALTALRGLVNILGWEYEDMSGLLTAACTSIMDRAGRPGSVICPGVLKNYGPLVVQIVKDKAHQQKVVDACIFQNSCPPPEFDDGQEPIDGASDYKTRQASKHFIDPSSSSEYEAQGDSDFFDAFGAHSSLEVEELPRQRRDADIFRVVQIADVHFDPDYSEGAVSTCGFHVCCRSNYNGTGKARHFGEYTCNAPPDTVELFLKKAAELNPDLVLQTGDTPPHHLWYETLDQQMESTKWLAQKLKEHIPSARIVPAIGNHDPFPSNMYYVPNADTKLLHEKFIENYDVFSHDEIKQTMRRGGYYEYPVKPGLRALVYNSNYGFTDNWFNLLSHYQEDDYLAMKQFVESRLAAARHDKAKVIFIAHHPAGDGIIPFDEWVTQMALDYSDVITLHVGGHKHTDLFKLFISNTKQWASGMQFAAPSSNTYNVINPSLRVYHLDKSTHKLLDFEQYYMDLEAADNEGATAVPDDQITAGPDDHITAGPDDHITASPDDHITAGPDDHIAAVPEDNSDSPVSDNSKVKSIKAATFTDQEPYVPPIVLAYKASTEYPLESMSPAAWHKLAISMLNDTDLLNQYQTNFRTRVSKRLRPNSGCEKADQKEQETCVRSKVCSMVSTTVLANMRCNRDGVRIPTGALPTEPPQVTTPENTASSLLPTILLVAIVTLLTFLQ